MTHIHPKDFPFSGDKATNFVPIYKQSSFKYLIYAEGHCAACRYGFMMQLGSVILKVESQCVADQMWYFPLLRPYYDHIPVKADLSDLREVLEWCHSHDAECREIAAHAKEVYGEYACRSFMRPCTVGRDMEVDELFPARVRLFIFISLNYASLFGTPYARCRQVRVAGRHP